MTLEERIVNEARRLGFAAVGFAVAGPSQTHERFVEWLARGCEAGMSYLRRHADLRRDPRALAPAAKTVIAVAARYPVNPDPGAGFSSYARGLDYHGVLREKLRRLAQFLAREGGATVARICVDSAPVAEREWAARAGIGWIGRQGQLVHPRLGCCLFLGEILTDLALAPTPPMPNRCGTCHRCRDACPTQAIGPDGLVDARRCISYLTVEHKGAIPEDLRSRLGGSLFGCDRCTAACPWNRFGAEAVMPEFLPRPLPSAEEILAMTEEQFEEQFRDHPARRTGLDRLKRNAAAANARLN